jgi:spermidine/putrescine transport system substrate-binding protein
MPANAKAALTDEQKVVLRFDEQPEFLERAQLYPAPDEALDKKMQDLWTDMLAPGPMITDEAGRAMAGCRGDGGRARGAAMDALGLCRSRARLDRGLLRDAVPGDGLGEPERSRHG